MSDAPQDAAGPAADELAADADTSTGADDGSAAKAFENCGDSAYVDGGTLHEQGPPGHDIRAKVMPVRSVNWYPKTSSAWTCEPQRQLSGPPYPWHPRRPSSPFSPLRALCGSCPE